MTIAIVALFVAVMSFQIGASEATELVRRIGAEGTTALRLGFAALLLTAVFRPWQVRVPRQMRLPLLWYGVALGAMNLLIYTALRTVPLGIAVALEFTGPLAVTVRHARSWVDAAWIVLVLLGLYALLPVHGLPHGVSPWGALAALGAGASWATYMVFGKRVGAALGVQASAVGTLIAAGLIVPAGLIQTGAVLLHPATLFKGFLLGVFSSAIPYPLEMMALARMPPRLYGMLTSLEPAIAALFGMLLLGQHLVPIQWLGITAIIIAAIGTTLTLAPAEPPPT